jgi:hypothetical protein
MQEEKENSNSEQASELPKVYGMPLAEFLHRVNLNWQERIAPNIWKSPDGCLRWRGNHSDDGYGIMRLSVVPSVRMHVVAYVFHTKAPIPKGYVVCHKCDVPDCINPEHLFLGTMQDNTQDMIAKGRKAKPYFSKLTTQQILDIKQLLREGKLTQTQIAKKFFVGQATISEIKNDRRPLFANTKDIRKVGS